MALSQWAISSEIIPPRDYEMSFKPGLFSIDESSTKTDSFLDHAAGGGKIEI